MDEQYVPTGQAKEQGIEGALGALLRDPALMEQLTAVIKGNATDPMPAVLAPPDTVSVASASPPAEEAVSPLMGEGGIASVLSDPALMQKLPQVMSVLAPLMNEGRGTHVQEKKREGGASDRRGRQCQRDDLLLALKPFLSPARCEAIDTLIRISRLGNALQNLK